MRVRARRVELVTEQVLAPDPLTPGLPELRLQRAYRNIAVGALIRAIAGESSGELELPSERRAAGGECLRRDHGQPGQRSVEHRAVDQLAFAGPLALSERDQDPDGRHQRAAADICDL